MILTDMGIDSGVISETEKRFEERESIRNETLDKIKSVHLSEVDSKQQIQMRLNRLNISTMTADRLDKGNILPMEPMEPVIALERVMGKSDLISISFLEKGMQVAQSVGRIHIRDRYNRLLGYGTGFLVSPRLLLTNNHVLENAETAATSQIEFNFQDSLLGGPVTSCVARLAPEELFLTDQFQDFTLVALCEADCRAETIQQLSWNMLIEESGKVILGEYVNIIQHPNGEVKQLALRENQVIDRLEYFLHYRTDTAPGSSGSPVYNDQWEVVALHHSGVPFKKNGQIMSTTPDVPWSPDMGDHRIKWLANEGVRISRIVKFIKQQNFSGVQRKLRDQMFNSVPSILDGKLERRVQTQGSLVSPVTPNGATGNNLLTQHAENGISLEIPLRININLGKPEPQPSASIQSVLPVNQPTPLHTDSTQATPSELQEVLQELATAKKKKYYDAKADQENSEPYYADLDTSSNPVTFFNALKTLLKKTHASQLTYQPSRHVYPWVDLQENLKIRSIYSNLEFDPEDFIREDFRIEQARVEKLHEALLTEGTLSQERITSIQNALEESLPYNCEHVVPQSWFGKREPMRGDLHHLFACESGCNSFRGNTPYFDFPDFEEKIRNACGRREENKFEPSAGKGAAARATFYFLLRYPGQIDNLPQEYTKDRIDLLLQWHQKYPPTLYEKHRNSVIFQKQGNRNPFIDFPEWTEQVDFHQGLS
jgi:endonuclease I/V8-like Glu-specific endopeptidase